MQILALQTTNGGIVDQHPALNLNFHGIIINNNKS
jgi:hypothetical protein